jgi:hypothetical protein
VNGILPNRGVGSPLPRHLIQAPTRVSLDFALTSVSLAEKVTLAQALPKRGRNRRVHSGPPPTILEQRSIDAKAAASRQKMCGW